MFYLSQKIIYEIAVKLRGGVYKIKVIYTMYNVYKICILSKRKLIVDINTRTFIISILSLNKLSLFC